MTSIQIIITMRFSAFFAEYTYILRIKIKISQSCSAGTVLPVNVDVNIVKVITAKRYNDMNPGTKIDYRANMIFYKQALKAQQIF